MPFVKGQAKPGGHELTPEDRARAHAKAAANREKRKALKLEDLKDKTGTALSITMEYLLEVDEETGEERLLSLLRESKLKEVGVFMGITTEKFLLTQGQPTSIVTHNDRVQGDKLFEALQEEWTKRKALSHRPITVDGVK